MHRIVGRHFEDSLLPRRLPRERQRENERKGREFPSNGRTDEPRRERTKAGTNKRTNSGVSIRASRDQYQPRWRAQDLYPAPNTIASSPLLSTPLHSSTTFSVSIQTTTVPNFFLFHSLPFCSHTRSCYCGTGISSPREALRDIVNNTRARIMGRREKSCMGYLLEPPAKRGRNSFLECDNSFHERDCPR